MVKTKVTLRDLSEKTGFDKSTISRVLRNDNTLSIRQENIDLIKKAAQELDYIPDAAGRSLRSARSFTIGALMPSLQNPIHAQIVEGASTACRKRGYSLIITQAEAAEMQLEVIHELVERNRVDGLLALTFRSEYSQLQLKREVPILAANWRSEDFESWVMVDERPGAYMATQHLIDLGHRKIAHLSGVPNRFNARERLEGYRAAMADAGIAEDPSLIETADYSYEAGFAAMNKLVDRKPGAFSAVFVVSMMAAVGALNALKKRGIDVPQDVSVTTFHDGVVAEVISPSLSTIRYPLMRTGEAAANGLMDILEGKRKVVNEIIGNQVFVARESSGPPGRDWSL